jgi:hypothetical protein
MIRYPREILLGSPHKPTREMMYELRFENTAERASDVTIGVLEG